MSPSRQQIYNTKKAQEKFKEDVDIDILINLFKASTNVDSNLLGPGLYLIYSNQQLLYVGEADCLMQRIPQQLKIKNFKENVTHISTMPLPLNRSTRRRYEYILIKILNPSYNTSEIRKFSLHSDAVEDVVKRLKTILAPLLEDKPLEYYNLY